MWREALSARLDGEEFSVGVSSAAIDAHLAMCKACQRWHEDASFITRLARLDGASSTGGSVPDSVLIATPRPTRARLAKVLRALLAVLGAGQILLAIAQFAGPMGSNDATLMHMTHEFAAWNAAIGASFLFIAWRRTRPAALLPLLTAFVGILTLLSADDLVHGVVSDGRLGTHVLLIAGYAVVVAMSRPSMTFDAPPGVRQRIRPSAWRLEPDDETERDVPAWREAPDSPAASVAERDVA
jgi:predicted anti-sigma-YlaC factor YlaD